MIEKITGGTWDAAIRERLIAPLGLEHTGTLPEEAMLHRVAVGHIEIEGEIQRAPAAFGLPRSAGPAGLINSTVGDVLTFARMHLSGGLAPDGTRVLSEESAEAMTEKQAECRTSTSSATRGASAGSGSAGTVAASSATTGTRSARRRSCACCPTPASP